jgi:hypothetical protein
VKYPCSSCGSCSEAIVLNGELRPPEPWKMLGRLLVCSELCERRVLKNSPNLQHSSPYNILNKCRQFIEEVKHKYPNAFD